MFRDFRFLARGYRLRLPAVISMALGIGASVVLFSLIKGILLTPLPYRDAERLVLLRARNVRLGEVRPFVSILDFLDWQRHTRSFDGMALYRFVQLDLPVDGDTERVQGLQVTPEFFRLLGLSTEAGAVPTSEEIGSRDDVIVLSRDLWRRRFGAERDIVGGTIPVNSWRSLPQVGSVAHRVLAVVDEPSRFLPATSGLDQRFVGIDDRVDFWLPLHYDETALLRREHRGLHGAVARLGADVTPERAQAELRALAHELAERHPDTNRDWSVDVVPVVEAVSGPIRPALRLLSAGVALLLLISCSAVASLQLVSCLERRQENALRRALGATSSDLLRQLLAESVTLALTASVLGVGMAWVGLRVLKSVAPPQLPRVDAIELDLGVLSFAVLLATGTGLLTGSAPAWIATRAPLAPRVESGSRAETRQGGHLLRALATLGIASAVILSIGAGLMHRSLSRLLAIDPGYVRENLLTLTVSLPEAKYRWRRNTEFLHESIERVSSLPGVIAVGAVRGLPGNETRIEAPILLPGGAADRSGAGPRAQIRVVSPTYFETMGIPLLAGRGFQPGDELGEMGYTKVVLINRTMAERFWPGETAIGKKFGILGAELPLMDVIGIVGDVRYRSLESPPGPEIYYPDALFPQPRSDVVVRTETAPLALSGLVQAEIRAVEPDVLITNVRSMEQALHHSVADRRFLAWLLKAFSLVSLVLAVVGIGGLMARSVALRRRELGIRLALGARPGQVVGMVLYQTVALTGIGLAMGLVGAATGTKLLSSFLYATAATDFPTYVVVSSTIAAFATLAAYLPARRAAGSDPLRTLRQD